MSNFNYAPPRFNVLLVEDNEDDVLLTKHAFRSLPFVVDLQVASDGLKAISMLRREPPYGDSSSPHLILLDLNMPKMDGRQLLVALKNDERLKHTPTIILSTSASDDDVWNAYRNHASAYMTKPIELREFRERMKRFADFWLSEICFVPSTDGR
jgi:two-component system, chemotaxis family, response regulator Rcp1